MDWRELQEDGDANASELELIPMVFPYHRLTELRVHMVDPMNV